MKVSYGSWIARLAIRHLSLTSRREGWTLLWAAGGTSFSISGVICGPVTGHLPGQCCSKDGRITQPPQATICFSVAVWRTALRCGKVMEVPLEPCHCPLL